VTRRGKPSSDATRSMLKMPTLKEMNRHCVCFFSCGGPFQQPASVPFRKFDEEVLRTLRGLRPHPVRAGSPGPPGRDGPLPLALDPERTRGALRREAAAGTAVSGGEGEDLKEAGGLRPPASFKTSPLPRLDSLLATLTRAGGGGGGGGRPRPFGMLPWRGREAARRDHQPQLVCELMTRNTRRYATP